MKRLGLTLVILAFLAGAFLAVLDPREINWAWFVPVLAAGTAGLVLYRRAVTSEARKSDRLAGNIQALGECLDRISEQLEELCSRATPVPTYQARFEIDRLFRADLDAFADARESMIHVFGMQNYADVMSNFAAGERYVNRVWSASTDGYVDEVNQYLQRARDQFAEARAHFHELADQFAQNRAAQPAA